MGNITVVITTWKRLHILPWQVDRILSQSVQPKRLIVEENGGNPRAVTDGIHIHESRLTHIYHPENEGTWNRWRLLADADTEYVALFDDDTVPGEHWFANCLEAMQEVEGMLATVGVVFGPPPLRVHGNRQNHRVGWPASNGKTEEADWLGHAWFMRREHAQIIAGTPPVFDGDDWFATGDDLHAPYALQLAGIGSYVPKHPASDKALWGSLKPNLGVDPHALDNRAGERDRRQQWADAQVSAGWKTIAMRAADVHGKEG